MNSYEPNRTGIAVLDQFGADFNALLREIDERESGANVVSLPARPRRTRLAVTFAAAATVLAALAVVAYGLLSGDAGVLTTDEAIADIARAASVQTLPPDDAYTFTRARIVESQRLLTPPTPGEQTVPSITYFVTSERQSWLSIARPGLIQTNRLDVAFARKSEEQEGRSRLKLGQSESTQTYPAIGSYRLGEKTYNREQIEEFPTDPQVIYDRLSAEVNTGNTADRELAIWNALTTPLTSAAAPLPPDLRAGLVEAIGLIPGVTTQGTVATPRGQEGTGFELKTNETQEQIIFDASTAAVLYEQSKPISDGAARAQGVEPGATLSSYELLDQKVTTDLPSTLR